MSEQNVSVRVELGQYRGLSARRPQIKVEEYEIESQLEDLAESKCSTRMVTDRPVAEGDMAVIDFEGFREGVPFEGGKGENYPLRIGSHSFIDTFEEQLIGAEVGSRVEVHVTFPENYGASELAGQPALFLVDIKGIEVKETPEFTDAYIQAEFGCENMEALRQRIGRQIMDRKQVTFEDARRQTLLMKAVENAVVELPEELLQDAIAQTMQGIEMNLQQQGITLQQYMQMTGMTTEQLMAQVRPQAEQESKTRLVLEAIARDEQFEVTEEEIQEQLMRFAQAYNMTMEKVKELLNEESMELVKGDLRVNKAVQLIVDTSVEE